MAAGSGGIRWNSTTNIIQLADENKNWIDWRYYNPNYEFQLITTDSTGNLQYTFEHPGLYFLFGSGASISSNIANPTTTASTKILVSTGGMASLVRLLANEGDTLKVSYSNNYNGFCVLVYIGSRYTDADLIQTNSADSDTTQQLSIDSQLNMVLLASTTAGGSTGLNMSTTSHYQYMDTTQDH